MARTKQTKCYLFRKHLLNAFLSQGYIYIYIKNMFSAFQGLASIRKADINK